MSVLGAGVAASVAQASVQSRQVAAQRDKHLNDAARQAEQDREVDQTHLLKVLEERDENETSARLRVEDQEGEHRPRPNPQAQTSRSTATSTSRPRGLWRFSDVVNW